MIKSKFFKNCIVLKDCIIIIMLLAVAAFPMGQLDSDKTESVYSMFFLLFKGIVDPNVNYNFYFAMYYSVAYILCIALFGVRYFIKRKRLLESLLFNLSFDLVCVALILSGNVNFKFYGLTSNMSLPLIICMVLDTGSVFIEYINLKAASKNESNVQVADTVNAQQVTDTVNEQAANAEIDLQGKEKVKGSLKRKIDYFRTIIATILSTGVLIALCLFIVPSDKNKMFYFYDINYGNSVNNELGDSYFGANGVDYAFMNKFIDNFVEGSKHVFYYQSANYYYWLNKINDKENEIRKLMPDSFSENDLGKYAKQIKKLKEEIEVINKALNTLSYERISITTIARSETEIIHWGGTTTTVRYYNDITEILYDTQFNRSAQYAIKWNNKDNKRLFCGQNIELTQTEFKEGTDFSAIKLGATINYYDGSMKKSYINVENYRELNNASRGRHTIIWSDSWGSYEYDITIS